MLNMGNEKMPEEAPLPKEMLPLVSVGSSINLSPFFTQPTVSNVPTRPTTPLQPDAGAAHDK